MHASVTGFDDPQSSGLYVCSGCAAGGFPESALLPMLLQHVGRDVLRHEEGIAAAGDSASNRSDFAERNKATAVAAHNLEIQVGGAEAAPPFTGAAYASRPRQNRPFRLSSSPPDFSVSTPRDSSEISAGGALPSTVPARTPSSQRSFCGLTMIRKVSVLVVSRGFQNACSERLSSAACRGSSILWPGATPMISPSFRLKRTQCTRFAMRTASSSQRCRIVMQVLTRASSNHGSAALSITAKMRKCRRAHPCNAKPYSTSSHARARQKAETARCAQQTPCGGPKIAVQIASAAQLQVGPIPDSQSARIAACLSLPPSPGGHTADFQPPHQVRGVGRNGTCRSRGEPRRRVLRG